MSNIKAAEADVSAEGLKDEYLQELEQFDEHMVVAPTVPLKYRGTITDIKDMHTLGKVQVLRVSANRDRMC